MTSGSLDELVSILSVCKPRPEIMKQATMLGDAPPDVIGAVYAIETFFRPWWFRLVEWGLAWALVPPAVLGRPILDITVGCLQVRLSWLFLAHGMRQKRLGNRVIVEASLSDLARVLNERSSIAAASFVLGQAWQGTSGDFRSRLERLGLIYNGTTQYGVALARLVQSWGGGK